MTRAVRRRAAWSRLRQDPVLLVGALLVLGQTVARTVLVAGSYYWQDDFVHLDLARRLGLSQEFLVRDHNGHLEIGANLVFWLIGRHAGLSFAPAAAWLLALQVMASCLLLAVLRDLFGRSPWLLLPFAGYLFTPLGLAVATWTAAGLEALPLQIGMLLALLGLVRALRRRSWRWGAVSVGGHALGLLFYEKALLVLPTLVAVLLLVEWADRPVGRRLRLLAGSWRYLLGHVLLVVVHLPLYLSVVDATTSLDLEAGTAVGWTGETIFGMVLPGLIGGPWTGSGAAATRLPTVGAATATFAALLVLVVVGAGVWLRGRRALGGWALVAGYVAVDVALVLVGRGQLLDMVVRDPRYVTDALPVIAIGCCAAFTGPLVDRRTPAWVRRAAGSTATALTVSAGLIVSCLVTTSLVAEGLQHREARDYVHGVLRTMDENPDVPVISSQPPWSVNIFGVPALEEMLLALGQERDFDRPGTELSMFDGSAELRPVTVLGPRLQAAGPAPGCGWSVGPEGRRLGRLTDVAGSPEVVRLGYLAGSRTTVRLAVEDDEQELTVPPGAGSAFFVITGQSGTVQVRTTGEQVCVLDVTVGPPWPAEVP